METTADIQPAPWQQGINDRDLKTPVKQNAFEATDQRSYQTMDSGAKLIVSTSFKDGFNLSPCSTTSTTSPSKHGRQLTVETSWCRNPAIPRMNRRISNPHLQYASNRTRIWSLYSSRSSEDDHEDCNQNDDAEQYVFRYGSGVSTHFRPISNFYRKVQNTQQGESVFQTRDMSQDPGSTIIPVDSIPTERTPLLHSQHHTQLTKMLVATHTQEQERVRRLKRIQFLCILGALLICLLISISYCIRPISDEVHHIIRQPHSKPKHI